MAPTQVAELQSITTMDTPEKSSMAPCPRAQQAESAFQKGHMGAAAPQLLETKTR